MSTDATVDEELQGKLLWEIGLFESAEASSKVFSELQTRSYVRCDDMKLRRKSASPLDVEFVINSYDVDGLRVYQCNIRDTERRQRVEEPISPAYDGIWGRPCSEIGERPLH